MVEHLHNHSLTKQVRGQIYMPFEQSPRSPLTFVLRARTDPLSLVPAIRGMLRARSRTAAMAKVRSMTEYVAREISPVSFTAVLAAIFGALALLLAATGVYGVFNYQISQRRPDVYKRQVAISARRTAFTASGPVKTSATSGSNNTARDPGRVLSANRFGLAFE